MILKALYDYYHRCEDLPKQGLELKEIGFLLVINKEGKFIRFEDRRIDKKSAQSFLVKKSVSRTVSVIANHFYDNSAYVFCYSEKGDDGKTKKNYECFKSLVSEVYKLLPNNEDVKAVYNFYKQDISDIQQALKADPLWTDIIGNLTKKYANFSFIIEGDTEIVASKPDVINAINQSDSKNSNTICLVTGNRSKCVEITTATMIPGSQATAKLVAFQVKSGYDSYGKEKGNNAPVSEEAEFAYTTALNTLLGKDSHNKFSIGNRTFVFWASSTNEVSKTAEDSIFAMFGQGQDNDDPNRGLEYVKKTFMSIYNGVLSSEKQDKFYILGLAPNSARIAVVYWAEIPLKEFAGIIVRHFSDMEIVGTRKDKRPYAGLHSILGAVTLGGKSSDATPNLPDAVVKSIFQGLPYPMSLYQACIRRIRAEQEVTPYGNPVRVAILKAYLNRLKDDNKKIEVMLDKNNSNVGYLCGRLFAVLDKVQYDANNISSIKERYLNSASATPSAVFPTILNLSSYHMEKLSQGSQIFYEKIKQDIMGMMSADGFPAHLDLQDQGRFFIGYYHQRQDFFTSKTEDSVTE